MAATPDVRRVVVSRTRPSAAPVQTGSPSTPLGRSLSSIYGSPGSFRTDEDNALIFEFGARTMRAGFAGEPAPRCTITHNPEQQTRMGEYQQFAPDYGRRVRKRKRGQDWDDGHVLWRANLEDVDLGLVQDKLERLVRIAEQKYLMLDNRSKRVALAVSSMLPRPLLSSVLGTIFTTLQATSVTLLPSSVMATVAAGLRSALVVDMGWEETFVYSVYEYREIRAASSVRAGRMLTREIRRGLDRKIKQQQSGSNQKSRVSFEEVDDIVVRGCWCRAHQLSGSEGQDVKQPLRIPLKQSNLPSSLEMTLEELSDPVESAFFATALKPSSDHTYIDDHDVPVPQLIYNALLHLPADLRRTCMSRIIFTGGCSRILGLKARILAELEEIISRRGWSAIKNRGSAGGGAQQHDEAESGARQPVIEQTHEALIDRSGNHWHNVDDSEDEARTTAKPTSAVGSVKRSDDYPSDRTLSTLTPGESEYLRKLRGTRTKQAQREEPHGPKVRVVGTGMTRITTDEGQEKSSTTAKPSQRISQPQTPAAFMSQEPDPILEKIHAAQRQEQHQTSASREATSPRSPAVMGSIDAQTHPSSVDTPTPPSEPSESSLSGSDLRAVSTLGAWQGASLLTNLRIKGAVEIEREKFLQHGLDVAFSSPVNVMATGATGIGRRDPAGGAAAAPGVSATVRSGIGLKMGGVAAS